MGVTLSDTLLSSDENHHQHFQRNDDGNGVGENVPKYNFIVVKK
jgi:hypothetical protein